MSHPSATSGAFGRPFPEQVAFFRKKLGNRVPTRRWDDLTRDAHDTAFVVAGATEADLLTDLAAAVDKALAEGRGIEEFRKDFRAIVARNGWTGWTGEGSVGGEAWRVKAILRTNAYTSYSAGRYAQLTEGNYPFWVYRHGDSKEPRLQHLSWDGLILVPGHIFWTTHYPPSDWGCSCYVLGASSMRAAARLGGDPNKTLPGNWQALDPKTGEQQGIGKGWGYAPGASVAGAVNTAAGKVGAWDYRVAKAFMDALPQADQDALSSAYRSLPSTADDARRYAQRVWQDQPDPSPGRTLGLVRSDQAAEMTKDTVLHANGFDFSLSPQELRHIRSEHGDVATEQRRGQRAIGPDDFARLPAIIDAGVPRYIGVSDGHKQPVFEIAATIDGQRYVARWEYWKRRRTLSLLSFFVRTGERT
jgi:hypothetical protein